MKRLLDPKNDWAFKQIFGQEKNKRILISFLNTMLEGVQEPIEDVEFLKIETDSEIIALRQSIVDVLCKTKDGKNFIVEMQRASDSGFIQRAVAYACRVYLNQRTKKNKSKNDHGGYNKMQPVIFLAIMQSTLFKDKKEYLSHHKVQDVLTGSCDIDQLSFSFLELSKFNKRFGELENDIERWTYYFKNAEDISPSRLEEILKGGTIFGEAYKVLEMSAYTPNQLLEYERYEMKEDEIQTRLNDVKEKAKKEGIAIGKAEGLEEGIEQKTREAALNMKADGLPNLTIAKYLGITEFELEKLLNG